MVSYLSRFLVTDESALPVNWTEQVILTVDQDFNNHNGGDIAFGPDGYLYLGLGDGGSGGDPRGRAQDTTRLLGSMLRIEVLDVPWPAPAYRIPPDNPFSDHPPCGPGANAQACPEIYAWGLRNPWRWSFDAASGRLWAGDVGQNAWEEVDIVERGGNYGWNCREGSHPFEPANCLAGGLVEPVAEYGRPLGHSVTGGYVYRGSAMPALVGRYVFGDFGSGRLWALRGDDSGRYRREELLATPYNIVSFAQDEQGELYLAHFGGELLRLEPGGPATADSIANWLSDTGCVTGADPTAPAAGLIPYVLNAPFWSDGAEKTRHLAIPDGTTIGIAGDLDWRLPIGSVVVKHFSLAGRLIETRLLVHHPDGVWAGYTYEWDDAQTNARRVRGGKVRRFGEQLWTYPSEAQCMECHTAAAGFVLGLETAQLNKVYVYPGTNRPVNQLAALDDVGLFSLPLGGTPAAWPRLVDPSDPSAALHLRARAYLHTNCSQCHRPDGPTPSSMDLRFATPLPDTYTCDVIPEGGDLGIVNARLVAPGESDRSTLPHRMARRDVHAMPPLGSLRVDRQGVALVSAWIDSLETCQGPQQ